MVPRHRAGLAKVGDARVQLLRQQDVLALDVAVQDGHGLRGVKVDQALGRAREDLNHRIHRRRVGRVLGQDKRGERAATDKLHDDQEVGLEAVSDKGHEVDVVNLGEGKDLLGEGLESILVDQACVGREDESTRGRKQAILSESFDRLIDGK